MVNQNQGQNFGEERQRKGDQHSPGNYKNDPERAREAGRKGGEQSHGGGRSSERE